MVLLSLDVMDEELDGSTELEAAVENSCADVEGMSALEGDGVETAGLASAEIMIELVGSAELAVTESSVAVEDVVPDDTSEEDGKTAFTVPAIKTELLIASVAGLEEVRGIPKVEAIGVVTASVVLLTSETVELGRADCVSVEDEETSSPVKLVGNESAEPDLVDVVSTSLVDVIESEVDVTSTGVIILVDETTAVVEAATPSSSSSSSPAVVVAASLLVG